MAVIGEFRARPKPETIAARATPNVVSDVGSKPRRWIDYATVPNRDPSGNNPYCEESDKLDVATTRM